MEKEKGIKEMMSLEGCLGNEWAKTDNFLKYFFIK